MAKKYVKFLWLLLGLAASGQAAQAQRNFQLGYVVRPAGDTLRGEVDVRGGKRMAHLCLFRPGAGAEVVRYAPTELQGYGLRAGAHFEAGQVPVAAVAGGPAGSAATAPLFLQVLAQGKATLYTFVDDNDVDHYFFRQSGAAPVELVQTTQVVGSGMGQREMQVTYPFRQVLSQAFRDCPGVQAKLVRAELKDAQLVAIFDRYNTCGPGQTAAVASRARVSKVHFGVLGGLQSATSTLNDGGEVGVKSALRPMLGVGLLINPASFNSKLAIRLEALYQKQLHEGSYQRYNSIITALNSNRNAQLTMQTLRVPLLLRYTLPKGLLRPYFQLGAEFSLLLDSKEALIIETNQNLGSTGTTTTTRQVEMRGYGYGPTAAFGVLIPAGTLGSVQLEGRINRLDGASLVFNELSGATSISFLLGYNFGG